MATHDNPNDWIPEEEIAKQLGVDRDVMRIQRRGLDAGEVRQDNNRLVCWARAAADRIAERLGLSVRFSEKNPPATVATTTPALPLGVEELTVISAPGRGGQHFGNAHLIRAKRLNGEIVTVRVVNSKKYVPRTRSGEPMTLKARPAASGTWWELYGREPRWPGIW